MPASGKYIKEHLYDFHLADLEKVMVNAAIDHMAHGCEYEPGWKERAMATVLNRLPDLMGEALEAEETYCPERGIGLKEAA